MSSNSKHPVLYQLLRILTPEELNELTTTSKGRNLISLTAMLTNDFEQEDLEDEKAKILPFKKPGAETQEELVSKKEIIFKVECGEKCKVLLDDYIKRVTVLNRKYSKNCPVDQEISTFIISEKTRFKESYNKLKSKEVLSLYKKNASVDVEREKSHTQSNSEESQSSSSDIGILINKKQA